MDDAQNEMPTWPYHMWRHTVVTGAVRLGAHVDIVNELLDHVGNDGRTRGCLMHGLGAVPEDEASFFAQWAKDMAKARKFNGERDFMRAAIKGRAFPGT